MMGNGVTPLVNGWRVKGRWRFIADPDEKGHFIRQPAGFRLYDAMGRNMGDFPSVASASRFAQAIEVGRELLERLPVNEQPTAYRGFLYGAGRNVTLDIEPFVEETPAGETTP